MEKRKIIRFMPLTVTLSQNGGGRCGMIQSRKAKHRQTNGSPPDKEKNRQTYEKITTDGTHLTEDGARIVAEKWLAETSNWLDKKV